MDSLKNEAIIMAVANGSISAFELFAKKQGLGSIALGGSSLAYAVYTYWQNSKKVQKDKNWGDYAGDVLKGGLDVFTGSIEGAGFLVKNAGLILLGVGGLAGIYVMTRFVSVAPPPAGVLDLGPSAVPVLIGASMGLSGAAILYLDDGLLKEASKPVTFADDPIGAVAHDVGTATESSLAALEGMTTTEGWGKFENNVTHPGQYFDKYGKQVSDAWGKVNSPGSFVDAMGWTAQVIGDAFTL